MTRLTEALERAGVIPKQDAGDVPKPVPPTWDLVETPETPEAPRLSVRPRAESPEVPQLSVRPRAEPPEVPQLSVRPRAETPEAPQLSVRPRAETAEVPELSLRPRAETAELPQLSLRPPKVAEISPTTHEPSSTPTLTSIRCPRCERLQGVPTGVRGLWERTVLALMRIRPYRCTFCGRRFHRFQVGGVQEATDQSPVEAFSTFLPPADTRNFQELIRDIAQAEQEQRIHGLVDAKQQPPESHKPEPWPPVSSVPKRHPRA
jgi:hypothetical protein